MYKILVTTVGYISYRGNRQVHSLCVEFDTREKAQIAISKIEESNSKSLLTSYNQYAIPLF